jgi:hypothetical protein
MARSESSLYPASDWVHWQSKFAPDFCSFAGRSPAVASHSLPSELRITFKSHPGNQKPTIIHSTFVTLFGQTINWLGGYDRLALNKFDRPMSGGIWVFHEGTTGDPGVPRIRTMSGGSFDLKPRK